MNETVDVHLSDAQRQLFGQALDLLAEKVGQDERTLGVEFPHFTRRDGSWQTYPASWSAGYTGGLWSHGHWTCGYWVGLLLAAYLRTHDDRLLVWASERFQLVARRSEDPNTHDIGFIFDGSAIPGFHITGERRYAEIAMQAASQLRARLVTTRTGAYLSSWGPHTDARGLTSSAIDTMGNLSLLYWAANHSGDGSFRHAAEAHAEKTRGAFIRRDGSTYHAVEYEPLTGRCARGYTFQGYNDESAWSRGQAWAIYGYVNTARETGKREYINVAEELADYYLKRLQGRDIPPWDFDDPAASDALRDSAAAAIVSAALVELGAIHPDPAVGGVWISRAVATLETLCRDYLARDSQHRGLLMHGCYSKPQDEGTDSATMFGDFYFVEALCKLILPGKFRPLPARVSW